MIPTFLILNSPSTYERGIASIFSEHSSRMTPYLESYLLEVAKKVQEFVEENSTFLRCKIEFKGSSSFRKHVFLKATDQNYKIQRIDLGELYLYLGSRGEFRYLNEEELTQKIKALIAKKITLSPPRILSKL